MQEAPESPLCLNNNELYKGQFAAKHILNEIIFFIKYNPYMENI